MATGTGVPGAANGKLYSLAISATDTGADGVSNSVIDRLDIIVGSNSADSIHITALGGLSGNATFIYGLGRGDVLDGSGMTGELWFASGAGADLMTGGSGVNRYLYSVLDDSIASSMDRITNFHSAHDVIDLSGISPSLHNTGLLPDVALGAHSVGWQPSNGNTFVYVNAGSALASVSSAELKIELIGTVALSSKNFVL
jgi:hypothetical protein